MPPDGRQTPGSLGPYFYTSAKVPTCLLCTFRATLLNETTLFLSSQECRATGAGTNHITVTGFYGCAQEKSEPTSGAEGSLSASGAMDATAKP
jgi:hypothetical protein